MGETLLYLDVPDCPACAGSHRYRFALQRETEETRRESSEAQIAVRSTRLLVCPNKGVEFETTLLLDGVDVDTVGRDGDQIPLEDAAGDPPVRLKGVQALTAHAKALSEAGAAMLVDSIEVGREFCKFMTTTALGAIPTYLALLALVTPKDYRAQSREELILLLPAFLFVVAAVLFVFGYFPRVTGHMCLDRPDEVSARRKEVVERRLTLSGWGFGLFCVAVVVGVLVVAGRLPG